MSDAVVRPWPASAALSPVDGTAAPMASLSTGGRHLILHNPVDV